MTANAAFLREPAHSPANEHASACVSVVRSLRSLSAAVLCRTPLAALEFRWAARVATGANTWAILLYILDHRLVIMGAHQIGR